MARRILTLTLLLGSPMAITSEIPADGELNVSVDVQNMGERDGDEVVQLYVRDVESRVKRPIKELRGFERIRLKPGERRRVTFSLEGEQLAFYDVSTHSFVVEPGRFDVMVGSSSELIRLQRAFRVRPARER